MASVSSKVSLTNGDAWPFCGKAKCPIRPRLWHWEQKAGLLLAYVLMVKTPPSSPLKTCSRQPEAQWHLHLVQFILNYSVAVHERIPLMTDTKYDKKRLFELGILPGLPHTAANDTDREPFVVVTLCPAIIAILNLNYGAAKRWWVFESMKIILHCIHLHTSQDSRQTLKCSLFVCFTVKVLNSFVPNSKAIRKHFLRNFQKLSEKHSTSQL